MEASEMSGSWWLPEASDIKVWGILSCSEAGELSLAIVGNLTDAWAIGRANPSLTILGETYGDQGQVVTLRGCFETNNTVSNNPLRNRQVFFAQRGYFGAHLPSADDPAFRNATLSYSGLASWAQGFTGFSKSEPFFASKWVKPTTRTAIVPGCRFELDARILYSHGTRKQTLAEDLVVRCEFDTPIPEPDFQSRIAYGLQGLLTFATGRPNALTQVRVNGTSESEGVRIVGPAIFSDESEASELHRGNMLFTLEDLGDRFENVILRWFAVSERYSEVLPLYFGGIYRPPGYTDVQFAQVLQTLTLYQSYRDAGPRDLLASGAVAHALTQLLSENASEFEPIVGDPKQTAEFILRVSNTQEYLLTRRMPQGGRALEGGDLYWLTEQLNWLFKIVLLKELGFTPDQISRLTRRNDSFNATRQQRLRTPESDA